MKDKIQNEILNVFLSSIAQNDQNKASSIRGITLVCPFKLLANAAELADTSVKKIKVNAVLSVYLVASMDRRRKDSYIVIPGRYCSCPVIGVCKHDLAVRLRLSFGPTEMIEAPMHILLKSLSCLI